MGFAEDMAAWAKKTQRKTSDVVAEVVISLSTAIIDRTPVGDVSLWDVQPTGKRRANYRPGTLVNSWHSEIGGPGRNDVRGPNTSGVASLANLAAIAPLAPGKIFTFTNPAPYTRRIEFGWSSQAPAGMVRLTVARFQQIVSKAARGN
jgi:hypothetical protein